VQWLVRKLMESRDDRGTRNKKQGVLNYKLKFDDEQDKVLSKDAEI